MSSVKSKTRHTRQVDFQVESKIIKIVTHVMWLQSTYLPYWPCFLLIYNSRLLVLNHAYNTRQLPDVTFFLEPLIMQSCRVSKMFFALTNVFHTHDLLLVTLNNRKESNVILHIQKARPIILLPAVVSWKGFTMTLTRIKHLLKINDWMKLVFSTQTRPHIWLWLRLAVHQSVVASAFSGNCSSLLD